MDEIIVRVTRTMASQPRLRILSRLAREREMTPTQLAVELRLPLNVLSLHLRTLVTAGLASRRKSGTWCYYRAESAYNNTTLSGKLAAWLKSLLKSAGQSVEHSGLLEVRNASPDLVTRLHEIIFEAATAFTDLRRLQILRYLMRQPTATAVEIVEALRISPQALGRHMHKLTRRGYVRIRHAEQQLAYELSPTGKSTIHGRMFEIVRGSWTEGESRTS